MKFELSLPVSKKRNRATKKLSPDFAFYAKEYSNSASTLKGKQCRQAQVSQAMTSHKKNELKPLPGKEPNVTTNNHSCSETHNHEVMDSNTEQQVYNTIKLKP